MSSYLSVDDRHPELCVIDKFLGPADVNELCERLKGSSYKKRVILKGNCLGSSGAVAMSSFLKENTSIQVLSLEWNQLGNDGAISLAKALETCSIVELDLRNNNIKSEGAAAIAKSIMINSTIVSLDLRWNQIEDAAALTFKEAILDRVPPLVLKINGNLLSADCASTIDKWLGREDFQEEKISTSASSSSSGNRGGNSKREFTGVSAVAEAAQSTILQKETSLLRSQNTTLQGELRDLQRQLDTSAVRVTELEQQFLKEEHRSNHYSEQLKTANMRIAMQMEELKNLTQSWEMDRQEHMSEMKRVAAEKEEEIRTASQERDRAKAALAKTEDKALNFQIQLEQLTRATEQERRATEEELSSALHQVTDLTTHEARTRSENAILKNAENRTQERIKQLETEIQTIKKQNQTDLENEFKTRGEEMDRLRAEFATMSSVAQEKSARQTRELAELYKKHAELQSEASTQRVEMQEKSDAAIAAVRESESKRCESTVTEFRTRLDAYLTSRAAMEVRCEGLSRELKTAQEQHISTSTHLEKQVKEMDQELRRLREQKLSMETAMATAQKECQLALEKASESHKRMTEQEGRLEDTQRSLQDCVLERGSLRTENAGLRQQIASQDTARRAEFAHMSEHLTLSLRKELESLKTSYRIGEPLEQQSLPSSPKNSATPKKSGK